MPVHRGPRIASIVAVAMVGALGVILSADVKFTSTFKSLDAASTSSLARSGGAGHFQ
jgi:hypothetical protein